MGECRVIQPWHNSLILMDTGPYFSVRRKYCMDKLISSPKARCNNRNSFRTNKYATGATTPLTKPLTTMKMVTPPNYTYSSTITTDIPLNESPIITLDSYLENKSRIFGAIFPDSRNSRRLNQEEWRIEMLPIQFLFLNARLVIDMRLRCKSQGKDYPAGIPCDTTKVLELKMIRWEMQGLDEILKPSHFSLVVDGVLYPVRHAGNRSRLKGQVRIKVSYDLPHALDLVPEYICRGAAETVLKTLVGNMKDQVHGSLLADYRKFKMENKSKADHNDNNLN